MLTISDTETEDEDGDEDEPQGPAWQPVLVYEKERKKKKKGNEVNTVDIFLHCMISCFIFLIRLAESPFLDICDVNELSSSRRR